MEGQPVDAFGIFAGRGVFEAGYAPHIQPRYLSHADDVQAALRGAQLIHRLSQTPALQGLIKEPMAPALESMNDAAMIDDFRARASTCYHPVGTCMMGSDPAHSVVDANLAVYGLQNLYVVDASVFPTVTSLNRAMSSGSRHGIDPSRPITRLCATAATRATIIS